MPSTAGVAYVTRSLSSPMSAPARTAQPRIRVFAELYDDLSGAGDDQTKHHGRSLPGLLALGGCPCLPVVQPVIVGPDHPNGAARGPVGSGRGRQRTTGDL
jgi:hypothetical protein